MWEPSEKEMEDCLEHGKSCSYGICSECVIGNAGGNNSCNSNRRNAGGGVGGAEHLDG